MITNKRTEYIKSNPHLVDVNSTYSSLVHHYPVAIRRKCIQSNLANGLFELQKYNVQQRLLIAVAENYAGAFNLFVMQQPEAN